MEAFAQKMAARAYRGWGSNDEQGLSLIVGLSMR
jgi:hypothetical protein